MFTKNTPQASGEVRSSVRSEADQSCRYCYATGHAKWSCPVLKAKSNKRFSGVKPDMLAVSPSKLNVNSLHTGLNSNYSPFISDGFVSLKDSDELMQIKNSL